MFTTISSSDGASSSRTGPRDEDASSGGFHLLHLCALLGGGAGIAAVAIRIATPFEHGIWLIAYLLLVGCAAPQLLATGETRLLDRPTPSATAGLQAGAWLLGTIAVPVGVLGDARLLVVIGAAALLVALCSLTRRAFADGAPAAPGASRSSRILHASVIAFMAGSTAVGVLLAWDVPWV